MMGWSIVFIILFNFGLTKEFKPQKPVSEVVDNRISWWSMIEVDYITKQVCAFRDMEKDGYADLSVKFQLQKTGELGNVMAFAPPKGLESPIVAQIGVDFTKRQVFYQIWELGGITLLFRGKLVLSKVHGNDQDVGIYKADIDKLPAACLGKPTSNHTRQMVAVFDKLGIHCIH